MDSTPLLTPLPVATTPRANSAVARDADFKSRWDAWIERGRVHEQIVRRRIGIWAVVLSVGAAIAYAFLR